MNPRIDCCPRGCADPDAPHRSRAVLPRSWAPRPDGSWRGLYRCPGCRHVWACNFHPVIAHVEWAS